MMRKTALVTLTLLATVLLYGQDIKDWIVGTGGKPALAVIDFRGSGSQPYMAAFNSTLFTDLQSSGLFEMKPKSMFPLNNPQRPEDLRAGTGQQGFSLADWAGAPVSASHLVFGYAAAVNGAFALYGYLDDARQTDPQSAQLLGQRYAGTLDEAGAIKVAHQFANDIIQKFGGTGSLLGSRIYYVSQKGSGASEISVMDWDGNNKKPLTRVGSLNLNPAVSPDGSRIAFLSYSQGSPRILMANTETGRALPFFNQDASINCTPAFTPDGKQIYYSSTAAGGMNQLYIAALDGRGFRRVSHREAIEVEPKVNPKNPDVIYFVSGPGPQQIYKMNSQGGAVERVTNGEGEASNPSWNPDGQHIAFSWTRGYAAGDWNVFVMDVATRQYVQLTHGGKDGKNENPVWAPDGRHLVFASTRSGRSQIYTMLADGSQVKQLTFDGVNRQPVWGLK